MAKISDQPGERRGVVTSALAANELLPHLQRVMATSRLDADLELLRDVHGVVSRRVLAPKWLRSDVVVIPTGSVRNGQPDTTAGSTCRSGPGREPASARTSRWWRLPLPSRLSLAESKSVLRTAISPSILV